MAQPARGGLAGSSRVERSRRRRWPLLVRLQARALGSPRRAACQQLDQHRVASRQALDDLAVARGS